MSKSIYEEMLEIIDKNFEFNNGHIVMGVSGRTKIEQALKQAKKQDRLLDLYRELSKLKDDVIHLVMSGKDYEHLRVKTVKIEQQIKELEK